MAKVYAFVADGMEEVECLAVCGLLEKSKGGCEACIHHGKKDGDRFPWI